MVAQFKYDKLAIRVDKLMQQYGRLPNTSYFRRNGVDREIKCLEDDFGPRERDGVLVQRDDVRYIISVVGETLTPDEELDTLILIDGGVETELLLVAKPKRTSPGGVNVFWQIHCRNK